MPPFLRLLPLPHQLTTDLPRPIAAGIGLAVSLPSVAIRMATELPQRVLTTGVALASRYAELASIGAAVVRGDAGRDDDDPFPSYAMNTDAWGAADAGANVVRLLEADRTEEAAAARTDAAAAAPEPGPAVPDVVAHDPSPAARFLAAAIDDREHTPAVVPARAELPIEGYDGLSAAALRGRLAGLSAADLTMLRDYEAGHARRVTVLQLLERNLARS